MTFSRRVLVTLEFDLDADPIAGVLQGAGGPNAPFAGWLGLTREIEVALESARDRDPQRAHARDDGGS